ncbi:MAG: response regulator [Lachnospiraceae bacterium]|nr:response regulator [Lachnospiraceae bacterium]
MSSKASYKKNDSEAQPSCVVGIGASAGGLEALQQFLTFLPGDTGMAFVIIQHLSPDHKSLLADILGKDTNMPVVEAEDGMRVERNHIYMIPPKYNLEIVSDILRLRKYNIKNINHPIDVFFRSLAAAYENRAVAVILSGTGSDGTNGIRSIKDKNGVIIVQTPESAKFDGMPRNAIATGFVDMVLNPDSIAREMRHIAASMVDAGNRLQLSDGDLMAQVFTILRNVTNVNYTYYKQTTILRRVERRIVVTHNRNLQEYVKYLSNNPDEARLLAKEVLIGVTSFFRDPDYFEVLKDRVIYDLVKNSSQSDQLRVWVAGCSTGEEAYSIAILFAEVMEDLGLRRDVKIFATDLDAESIAVAGRGVYGDNISEDVSVSRLSRFFTRKGNHYIVGHEIRKMIVFAQHNVFQDPPFGKLDLISCRNLLIYFQNILQRNLFAIFHVALNDRGYLFLGRSESVIDYDDVFKVVCANEKIFIHNASGKAPSHDQIQYSMQSVENNMDNVGYIHNMPEPEISLTSGELDTRILEMLMPASVLVDEKNKLVHSYGDCSGFITLPVGAVTLDIFSLVKPELKIAISKALKEARESQKRVAYGDIPVTFGDHREMISLVAQPIRDRLGSETGMTVLAFLREKESNEQIDLKEYRVDTAAAERITDLEMELHVAHDSLKKTVTELESVNAELQAANEELLTANEELQSSNEELQSVNEELYTVNSEYQTKVNELAALNDDMANFLSTTLVGIIMVDRNLNIRKYTEYIATEFHVADQDVGRSLRYIAFNFATIDLIALCRQVLSTMQPIEKNCASVAGKTYLVRIAPYIATEKEKEREQHAAELRSREGMESEPHDLNGLVITFIDTTKQVNDRQQIEEMAKALRVAVRTGREKEAFLSHMSHDMRTPMTAIIGLVQLSLQEKNLAPQLKENLDKIQSSGRYLLSLIDEVLETSRINAGKVVSVSTAARETRVIEEVNSIIGQKAADAGLQFKSRVKDCNDEYVMMDIEHVERILINLLSNAVKFSKPGGKVDFVTSVSYKGNRARHVYTITDNGRGISEDFLKKMFLPFEQETRDEVTLRDGQGLGLYICKNLVDLLQGTINCESVKGKGTTFTVVLEYELATDEQISLQMRRKSTYEDRVLYGKNVLVAEDNSINAEVIMKILETRGIHSELARDGQEVVDMFLKRGPYHYQAILMDMMMPLMDGQSAARAIRESGAADAREIPILALTADTYGDIEQRCMSAGMDGYLRKPIDTDELFRVLVREFDKE